MRQEQQLGWKQRKKVETRQSGEENIFLNGGGVGLVTVRRAVDRLEMKFPWV